jgi:hypothetical protein
MKKGFNPAQLLTLITAVATGLDWVVKAGILSEATTIKVLMVTSAISALLGPLRNKIEPPSPSQFQTTTVPVPPAPPASPK